MKRLHNYLSKIEWEEWEKKLQMQDFLPSYKVKFKLTKRCNLKCKKCNYWRNPSNDEISTLKAKEVIRQIAEIGCGFIKFSGGEILLRNDLPELVTYVRSFGIEASITSNGTLINYSKANDLITSDISQVNISLDSDDSNTHDKLVGVVGSFKKSTEAFRLLNDAKKRHGKSTNLVLQTVICEDNIENIEMIAHMAHEIGANSLSILGLVTNHLNDTSINASSDKIRIFVNEGLPKLRLTCSQLGLAFVNSGYNKKSLMGNYNEINPCYVPYIEYYIAPDGGVYPCCFARTDRFKMGNIFNNSIGEILSSFTFKKFRSQTYPVCKNMVCKTCIGEIKLNEKIKRFWIGEI